MIVREVGDWMPTNDPRLDDDMEFDQWLWLNDKPDTDESYEEWVQLREEMD